MNLTAPDMDAQRACAENNNHVTYEWLRSVGFRLDHHHCDNVPHMSLSLWDQAADGQKRDHDSHSLEMAPTVVRGYNVHEWHLWFRDDLAHTKARFLHMRHITNRDQVCRIVAALTDTPLAECKWHPEKFAIALAAETEDCERRFREYVNHDRVPSHP